jgi:hypothetical protein
LALKHAGPEIRAFGTEQMLSSHSQKVIKAPERAGCTVRLCGSTRITSFPSLPSAIGTATLVRRHVLRFVGFAPQLLAHAALVTRFLNTRHG